MTTRRYLLGTYDDRLKIDKLMTRRNPGVITYEFSHLCTEFLEMLTDYEARNIRDADILLLDFLDEFETDVRETNSLYGVNLTNYVSDVGEAIGFFSNYLDLLDLFPTEEGLKVFPGTPLSVLRFELTTYKPSLYKY